MTPSDGPTSPLLPARLSLRRLVSAIPLKTSAQIVSELAESIHQVCFRVLPWVSDLEELVGCFFPGIPSISTDVRVRDPLKNVELMLHLATRSVALLLFAFAAVGNYDGSFVKFFILEKTSWAARARTLRPDPLLEDSSRL